MAPLEKVKKRVAIRNIDIVVNTRLLLKSNRIPSKDTLEAVRPSLRSLDGVLLLFITKLLLPLLNSKNRARKQGARRRLPIN